MAALCLALALIVQDVPDRREQDALVAEFFALDVATAEGRAREAQILARLADVPFPEGSARRKVDKTFDKLRKELPTLPKKSGEYFDLGETSGRYFLTGNLKSPKGLFIGMHGGGVDSGDANAAYQSYSDAIRKRKWVGIFPEVLEKTERGWTDSGTEEWVLSLVDRALRTFDIDPNHVYFGGHSMGGYGSWVLGAHHADRVAALVPSAGAPTPTMSRDGRVLSIQIGVVPNLRNVAMCVFQSTDDPKVGPEANQAAVKEVERARSRWGGYENFEYWEVDDVGHGWPAGGTEALVAKIDGFERDPHPQKIVWQPGIDWKRQFYWLLWEEPRVGTTIVAELDREANRIDLELRGTDGKGVSMLLSDALVDMERAVVITANEVEVFNAVPERSFAALLRAARSGDPGRGYEAIVPVKSPE